MANASLARIHTHIRTHTLVYARTANGRVVPIRFTVPRTRLEYFQDDIYPPTRDSSAVMSASEWLGGAAKPPTLVELMPSDMTPLSRAPVVEKTGPKYRLEEKQEKKSDVTDEVFQRMNAKKGISSREDAELATREGVDESEWD